MPLTCLVTGATSGIGEAIAARLAGEGADVLVAHTAERGYDAVARIRRQVPEAQIEILAADLSALDEVQALAEWMVLRSISRPTTCRRFY